MRSVVLGQLDHFRYADTRLFIVIFYIDVVFVIENVLQISKSGTYSFGNSLCSITCKEDLVFGKFKENINGFRRQILDFIDHQIV
jgi:hypothetical protein